MESSRPGELLSQDTFYVGHLKGMGKVYLHAVVDAFGSHAFGFLHPSKRPEAVLTDNGWEYCGVEGHPYETYLELNYIKHQRTWVRRPQTNGFVERFNRTVLEEFFRVRFRERFDDSVEALQKDLDQWLRFYNRERPHLGYRNQGRTPYETVLQYAKKTVKKAG